MAKIIGIYKITSPTGKIYIGQSNNIESRFTGYKRLTCKGQRKLYFSFLKHTVEAHIFEIIHVCDVDELNHFEDMYIKHFDSFNTKHGLNLHSGGDRHTVSDETRVKLSVAKKGKASPLKGIPRSDEMRRILKEMFIMRTRKMRMAGGSMEYQCTKCLEYLPSDRFYPKKRSVTLFTPHCKKCFLDINYGSKRKNRKIKINKSEHLNIINLFRIGERQKEIADKYKVSPGCIRWVLLKNKII